MDRPLFLVALLVFIFAQTGCGAFHREGLPGYTQVNVQRTTTAAAERQDELFEGLLTQGLPEVLEPFTVPAADLVIFAVDSTNSSNYGVHYYSSASNTASIWTIPNGSYKFTAVGYDGANMASNSYCGRGVGDDGVAGDSLALTGGSKNVSITMNTGSSTTQAPPYGPSGFSSALNLQLRFCNSAFNSGETNFSSASSCAGLLYTNSAYTGSLGSVKISYFPQDAFGGSAASPSYSNTASQMSQCFTVTTGSGITTNLPIVGNPSSELKMKAFVLAYSDSSCSTLVGTYEFNNGLADPTQVVFNGTSSSTVAGWGISGSSGIVWIYL